MINISKEKLQNVCSVSNGMGEVIRSLNLNENGSTRRELKTLCKNFGITIPKYKAKTLYENIIKVCPVCGKKFSTLKGHKREKIVCSHSCSNTYFRSGKNNPNYVNGMAGESEYRVICFKHHEKKCIICGFDIIVEVHHVDCNKNNNQPNNLVPLCPNHHRMFHSRYRSMVEPLIEEYLTGYSEMV